MKTLWVFGDSLSLPTNVKSPGWPAILAKLLNFKLNNFAQEAADNLYIYHCYRQYIKQIDHTDLVIIGWTHPSRKSFVFDHTNSLHQQEIANGIAYNQVPPTFFRSSNSDNNNLTKWKKLVPIPRNNKFYDTWFDNYYSEYEQCCLLESFHYGATNTVPGTYIPWFFSNESIKNLNFDSHETMLEFIEKNRYEISPTDGHLNDDGHNAWANHLYKLVQLSGPSIFPAIELFDRLAIAEIKQDFIKSNFNEVEFYRKQCSKYNTLKIKKEFDNLKQIHKEIWHLEKELKSGTESSLDLAEIGRRAILIRNKNNERIKLKNQIAQKLDCKVIEIKKDHLSE